MILIFLFVTAAAYDSYVIYSVASLQTLILGMYASTLDKKFCHYC